MKKCTEEDPYVTICEAGERCDVSIDTAESIVHSNLSLRKIAARWVPHLLMEQSKNKRAECSSDLLKMFEPDGPKCL